MKKLALTLIAAVLFAVTAPSVTYAATLEISNTVKAAFDKTAAAADFLLRSKLQSQYGDFVTSLEQDRKWDVSIKSLHYKNEEALTVLSKQIKQIDADKIKKLEAEAAQTTERYKPLMDLYKVIKTGSVKTAVQLARIDIQTKEAALKTAKDKVKNTAAKIRETLAGIDAVKVQIKAERSAAKLPMDKLSTEWRTFSQLVKKTDARNASNSLTVLNTASSQIADKKQNQYNMESKISGIIQKAKGQLP